MDENAYKSTYNALNQNDCPFEKAMVICRHACQNSRRIGIGERLAIGCATTEARKTCRELLALLHDNAAFALHLTDTTVLPHAKELKVQCGGLRGLHNALVPENQEAAEITNIFTLVAEAQEHFNGLENLPFSEIVRSIVHFEGRRRGKG